MSDELQLLEIMSKTRFADVDLARALVLQTRGWPQGKLENFFEVALNSGLLKRGGAEELLKHMARLGAAQRPEDLPELARLRTDVDALRRQRERFQSEHGQVAALQAKVRQLERELESERETAQSLTDEIIRLENEMRHLDRLIEEVGA